MAKPVFHTITQQVAEHLKSQIKKGRWTLNMPGRIELSRELGVSDQTVEGALMMLEKTGVIVGAGPGRPRTITRGRLDKLAEKPLRVALLVGERADQQRDYLVAIKHKLGEAGHEAFFTPWFMPELGMNVAAIARRLRRTEADAWIVLSAARPLLEWFVEQQIPAFALFGRRRGLPLAGVGPDKPPAVAKATRRLLELGHQRIIYLTLRAQRLPQPGASVQPFLDELAAHGITPRAFHLPDWEEDLGSFQSCLESLFRHTPPTALIVDEAAFFIGTLMFLQSRGLRVPEDVSLICTDDDRYFAWCRPKVAHIGWESAPVVRRAMSWARNLGQGKTDVRQTLTKSEFVEGGTIGPVRKTI